MNCLARPVATQRRRGRPPASQVNIATLRRRYHRVKEELAQLSSPIKPATTPKWRLMVERKLARAHAFARRHAERELIAEYLRQLRAHHLEERRRKEQKERAERRRAEEAMRAECARIRAEHSALLQAEAKRFFGALPQGMAQFPDGRWTFTAISRPDQDQLTVERILEVLRPLHPTVQRLCAGVLDGASLDEAAAEAGLSDTQLATLLPKLRRFLAPHLGITRDAEHALPQGATVSNRCKARTTGAFEQVPLYPLSTGNASCR